MKPFLATLTLKKINNLLKNRASYYISRLTKTAKIYGKPVSLSIEPSTICQLRCPECVLGSGNLKRNNKFIDFALYKKIIDETADTLSYLMLYFQGEPFLAPQIFEMIAYANSKNIYTATSTNAQNISDKMAQKLVFSGLKKLIISLDGVTQETYSKYRIGGKIENVFSAIEKINAEKSKNNSKTPEIELQFIVFRHNEHEIEKFKQLAKELNVQKIAIKTAQIYNFAEKSELIPKTEKYSRYIYKKGVWKLKKNQKNHCLRQWQGSVITTDGEFLPCCFDKNAENLFGNVTTESVNSLWKNEKSMQFRQQILENRQKIEICQNCSE